MIIPNICKNQKCSKPPTSNPKNDEKRLIRGASSQSSHQLMVTVEVATCPSGKPQIQGCTFFKVQSAMAAILNWWRAILVFTEKLCLIHVAREVHVDRRLSFWRIAAVRWSPVFLQSCWVFPWKGGKMHSEIWRKPLWDDIMITSCCCGLIGNCSKCTAGWKDLY